MAGNDKARGANVTSGSRSSRFSGGYRPGMYGGYRPSWANRFSSGLGSGNWKLGDMLKLPQSLRETGKDLLVGGLVGAALVQGGVQAVRWGGIVDRRPVGVFGVLITLAVSPLLGFGAGWLGRRASIPAAGRRACRWPSSPGWPPYRTGRRRGNGPDRS